MLRLAHFTDLHVTESPSRIPWRSLFSKRLLGWANLVVLGRHRVFADASEVARALVADLAEVRPDFVVSSGDFTGIALPSEFRAAREALAPLLEDPRVTGIPGNHDVYVQGAVRDRLYEQAFGAWTRTDLSPHDFPASLRDLYPYPLVRLLGEEAALICLKDSRPSAPHDSSGLAGARQLEALDALLEHPRIGRRLKILALHYGLCRANRKADSRHHGLRDARRVIEIVRSRSVSLVIHGHMHGRMVLPPDEGWPFAIANPGSVSSSKAHHSRAYHLFSIEGGRVRLEARRYRPDAKRFEAWPEAPGAGWIVG